MNAIDTTLPKIIRPQGVVMIQGALTLEELGDLLSQTLFGGLPFGGRADNWMEEIPCIYLKNGFLGLVVTLSGDPHSGYFLHVNCPFYVPGLENERVNLDGYLFEYLKVQLAEYDEINLRATADYGHKCHPE